MTKKKRQEVYDKFDGLCAYTGKPLGDDWQVDHLESQFSFFSSGKNGQDDIDNLMPCQRIVNHYKRGQKLETFREWYLGKLHFRLKYLPKNPKSERGIRRKEYLLKVADLFGITEDKPFDGKFYFEKLEKQ